GDCAARKLVQFDVPSPKNGPFTTYMGLVTAAEEDCAADAAEDKRLRCDDKTVSRYVKKASESQQKYARAEYKLRDRIRPVIVKVGNEFGIQSGRSSKEP